MTIALTGATGQFGGLVVEALLQRTSADNLVALVRSPEKAAHLKDQGITVRHFDYDEPEGLPGALEGVDRLLLVSGNEIGRRVPQHQAVIEAAKAAGVSFFAYTSFLHLEQASIIAVAPEHKETEKLLADAPFTTALLRNGWYTENFEDLVKQSAASGSLLNSAGDGRISSATRKDYAEAAAVVLTAEAPESAVYELAADQSWNLSDLAETVSAASGKKVERQDVSAEEHRQLLIDGGAPEGLADFLVGTDQAIAAGELEDSNSQVLSGLIGRPTTPLKDVVSQWLS